MLTVTARWNSGTMRTLVAMMFFCMYLFWFAPTTAFADTDDLDCWAETEDGLVYICEDEEEDRDGNDGSGGGEPPCDLDTIIGSGVEGKAQYWCEGEHACWANFPSAHYGPEGPEDEEPPSENHMYIYKQCVDAEGETVPDLSWMWYEPPEPPLDALALQAYGRLDTPEFTLAFSPPERSYILMETWWGAEGARSGEIVGTSALGVRAIGEPDYIEVNPGDGSGTIQCPWTTEPSEACVHTYTRASVNGSATSSDGSPAYLAEARLVYEVRFEQNSSPLDVPGAPDSLESLWVTTPVPVAEVQTTVTR